VPKIYEASSKKIRKLRGVRKNSPYGISAEKKAALRNPRYTRAKAKVLNEFENGEYYLQPAAPKKFFKGSRPHWITPSLIWNSWGGKGVTKCIKCSKIADAIDHKIDWKSHVLKCCDWEIEVCDGGYWEGLLSEDVLTAYNDSSNLQPMCTKCNSSKNGPKDIDLLKPTFKKK